jgi:hypothetical protein
MVTHWDDVKRRDVELGEPRGTWPRLGRAAEAAAVGANRIDAAPGGRSTPVHARTVEEELSRQDGRPPRWRRVAPRGLGVRFRVEAVEYRDGEA